MHGVCGNNHGIGIPGSAHGQDAHATILKRQGAHLPHWTTDNGIYAVTFRLADSIPQAVLRQWQFERTNIIATAKWLNRPPTLAEQKRLARLFAERIDKYLDAGFGACWLRLEPVAGIVAEALRHFDHIRYRMSAWSIMPNHVHAVLQPIAGYQLWQILHSWKSYTAKEANRYLQRRGAFWQDEPYDHLVRGEEDFARQVEYVIQNPAKAGLRDWKWVWVDEEVRRWLESR